VERDDATLGPSQLLTADLSKLREFLAQRLPEGANLDYKRDLGDGIAETVAAMANSEGGTIVVGVEEDKATKTPAAAEGFSARDAGGALTNVLRVYLDPVPTLESRVIPVGSTTSVFLVVLVHPSTHRVVLHRDKGVLVRVGDQSAAPARSEFERLLARERAAETEVLDALSDVQAVSGVHWGAGSASTRLGVYMGCQPVRPQVTPVDDDLDRALETAACALLLPGWRLKTAPDRSTLDRGERKSGELEYVRLNRSSLLDADFTSQRVGWHMNPDWAINATDLASDLIAVAMLPFALARVDPRAAVPPYAVTIGINGWAGKSLFFPPSPPSSAPAPSPDPVHPGGPVAARAGVLSQPSDVVGLAVGAVRDLARIYGIRGADIWAARFRGQLPGHNPRLDGWESELLA
jgi:hypothetical protein